MGFENSAGLNVLNHYGVRSVNQKFGGRTDDDLIKTASWTFNYNELPAGSTGKLEMSIPAYSKILSARFEVLTGFTSTSTTTDLDIGLQTAAGVEIDLDGFVTAAQATQTVIATRGNFVVGAGALVGASIGAAAGELVVTPTVADLLTGKARVIVEYITEGV